MNTIADKDYIGFLTKIKEKIRSSRLRAAFALNREVIELYWYIGKEIIEKQELAKWGTKLIETLAADLQRDFPETHGFSIANVKRMKRFAEEYPNLDEIGAQAVRQLPWSQIIHLFQRIKDFHCISCYTNDCHWCASRFFLT